MKNADQILGFRACWEKGICPRRVLIEGQKLSVVCSRCRPQEKTEAEREKKLLEILNR